MSNRLFTSWVRRGAAAATTEPDPASGAWPGPARFQPSLILTKDGVAQPAIPGPALSLLGPGAVSGLNPKLVVRTDPQDGASGVEDNYLALVEFSRADLPWMFTPARPNSLNRLRPWLVLIVVDAATAQIQPGTPLPRISVHDTDLPDLADSWGWAHSQVTVDDPAKAADELTPAAGTSAISRLLCPRRLMPDTSYIACVVPATLDGVQAGLGLPPGPGPAIAPAWTAGSGQDMLLPVYYSWRFSTGDDGDFKSLVGRLRGVRPTDLAGFGTRTVDMSAPWQNGDQLTPGATFGLGGALGSGADLPLDDTNKAAFETRLTTLLNFPADLQSAQAPVDPALSAVAPPLYGGRHAGAIRVPSSAGWLRTLNLDPRRRIAAAYGARFVQENQEFLMTQAWNQLGAVQEANRLQALAELACEVGDRMHQRHIASLGSSEITAIAAPARTRILLQPAAVSALTLHAIFAATPVPAGSATVAFSRFARSQGPLGKRFFTGTIPAVISEGLVGSLQVPAVLQDGIVTLAAAPAAPAPGDPAAALAARGWQVVASLEAGIPAQNLASLVQVTNSHLQGPPVNVKGGKPPMLRILPAAPVAMEVDAVNALTSTLATALTPSTGILKRFQSRVNIPTRLAASSTSRVMASPQFTAPLAMALKTTHPDWLLPGLGNFPDNSVAVLSGDGAFVESFLVGANHEMNRELLWREYPTDQRGTPFQYFWPRPDRSPDIPPITSWPLANSLGSNGAKAGPDIENLVVLLVRGEILHRYPRTIVHMAPGIFNGVSLTLDPAGQWLVPEFMLNLDGRTTAFAYNLNLADIKSNLPVNAGYYFVFSEPLTGPRFNLDAVPGVPQARGFTVAGEDPVPTLGNGAAGSPRWNLDSADIARLTFARPFRVAFHADELLAAGE